AQISCAHVFAAQKQCFCLELLSAQNCLRALRFKRSGRLARTFVYVLGQMGNKCGNVDCMLQICKSGKESVKPRKPCRIQHAFATSALANCTSNQPLALTKEPRTT
ncbi:hypothetical protein HMPREF1581_01342, partial [Gardnerella vaginalis JCP8108]